MLRTRLNESLAAAVKARNERATSTLRLILAALKDRDIAERGKGNPAGLSDDQIVGLLQSMIKQRRESIELYQRGGRPDLASQEGEEIAIIEGFLPAQMAEQEMANAVTAVIDETEAKSMKDMGRVMAVLKERFPGQMDFAKASVLVKARLAG